MDSKQTNTYTHKHDRKHQHHYTIIIPHDDAVSAPPSDIEFNLTGSYGSPIHTNHNSNYSSMPSPDMDQSERKQPHDQSRRPLSVATDNMMLEFYKKDGYDAKCILGCPQLTLSHSFLSLSTHASYQASDTQRLNLNMHANLKCIYRGGIFTYPAD